jgi:hypothetical protein
MAAATVAAVTTALSAGMCMEATVGQRADMTEARWPTSELGDERISAEEVIRRALEALVPPRTLGEPISPVRKTLRRPDLALRRGSRRGDSNP